MSKWFELASFKQTATLMSLKHVKLTTVTQEMNGAAFLSYNQKNIG